jgi:thymidylate kinase
MQITITGPRGCGKTTAAIEIAKFLRDRGCDVRIVGATQSRTDRLSREIEGDSNPDSMRLPLPVVIVDSFERHGEDDIKRIAAVSH